MLTMFGSRLWILSRSTLNSQSFFARCLFFSVLPFATVHFMTSRWFWNGYFWQFFFFISIFQLSELSNKAPWTTDQQRIINACKVHLFFWYANFLYTKRRYRVNSDGTRVRMHIYQAVKKNSQSCIIRCKNSRLRLSSVIFFYYFSVQFFIFSNR